MRTMNRQQLRFQKIKMQWEGQMLKPPTRKQARAWLSPITKALNELKTGEVDCVRGYPITQIRWAGNEIARVDHAINGFVSLLDRINTQLDTKHLASLANKLTNGIMLTQKEIDWALLVVRSAEDYIIKVPRNRLIDFARTEMIYQEITQQGLTNGT